MTWGLKDLVSLLPQELQKTPGISKILSIIISLFAYLKVGDKVELPGIVIRKEADDLFSLKTETKEEELQGLYEEEK